MNKTNKTNQPPLPTDQELIDTPDVFIEILAGRSPASFVYRDELVTAFMDIQPVNAGHVLVIPNQPARFLHELDDESAARMFVVAGKIASAIRESGLPCQGINLLLADGAAAGQEIPHAHLHVVPRFEGDGFGFRFPERYFTLPARELLDEVAAEIRETLG